MTLWPLGREVREQLERIEKTVQDLERSEKDRVRAHEGQAATLTTLGERLGQLEQQVSSVCAVLEARFDDVRQSVDRVGSDVGQSLTKVARSLKGVRRSQKGRKNDLQRVLEQLAKVGVAFDTSVDPRFLEVAEPLVRTRRTMLGYDRLFTLWQAAGNTARLNLPAVEVGTFRGGSAVLLAEALREFAAAEREVHVVDTFEGHLDSTFSEHDPEAQRGKFRTVRYEEVREYLTAVPGIHVYKGNALSVISSWPERRYSLVHIDVDLYRPTLECLEYFGPRVAEGGIIVMDDYEAPTCPGVSRATREYLARAPGFQTWRLQPEQIVLVKGNLADGSPHGSSFTR